MSPPKQNARHPPMTRSRESPGKPAPKNTAPCGPSVALHQDGPHVRLEGFLMRRFLAAAATVAIAILLAKTASAQSPEQDAAFNFRVGGFYPRGHSDFWDTQKATYTLDRSDFA